MKLQKLSIHNIASIEDAVIDFDSKPLSRSEVFLISGKTGAGKSTILDAICLALYSTTPRLKNTNMQGESTDIDKEVKVDDPRQLMRRNTGEAYVELTFTGSNGIRYESRWSVARARNKAHGNLQERKWQLTDIDHNYTFTKKKEIEDEIHAAVGLDFSQFCRTTMLAQGEFTKFLNSNDKEKAEILEKITGVDIYSRIGKKVFEVTNAKQLDWENAESLVEGIKVMNEEEIAETKVKIREVEDHQTKLKAERENAEKKLRWLHEDMILTKKIEVATEKYDEAKAKTDDENFKIKETLTTQWNATIDARGWLRNLKSSLHTISQQEQVLAGLRLEHNKLKRGKEWLIADIQATENKLHSTEREIESEKDKIGIYANVQTIIGLMETIENGTRKINLETESLKKIQLQLDGELTEKKEIMTAAYNKAMQDLEKQQTFQNNIEQNLEALNLQELRKEKELRQNVIIDITAALGKLDLLAKEHEQNVRKKKAINEHKKTLSKLKEDLLELAPRIHDAKIKADTCREILDKQHESVDKWAKSLRARLHVGEMCPVCFQKITDIIPHEEKIEALYAAAEQSWKEADQNLSSLKDEEKRLSAEIKSHTNLLNKAEIDLEQSQNLYAMENMALKACQKCGVMTTDPSSRTILTTMQAEAKSKLEDLNIRIKTAEGIETSLQESRSITDLRRTDLDKAKKDMDNAERDYEKQRNAIHTCKTLIETKKKEVAAAKEKADEILGESQWDSDRNDDIHAFVDELTTSTRMYNNIVSEYHKLQQTLNDKNTLLSHLTKPMEAISTLMPDWDNGVSEKEEIKNPLDKANNLRIAVHTACEQLMAAKTTSATMRKNLNEYLAANSEMNFELLSTLDTYPAASITDIVKDLAGLRENLLSCKTIKEQIIKQHLEHTETKPTFEEEDNTQNLENKIERIDKDQNALLEKKGVLNQLLSQDKKNKKTQASLLADASNKKDIYQRWSRINQLIGDATGSKFRKIAQSYILTNLIHSANSYMRTLTDRYILKVEPGTFVIMLEDAYQGYVRRAASTISGGEAFLVSLALALALSDIGSKLSVDTLFIDEGFGTLSGEPLQKAIETLRTLHNKSARNVGIISHVEELRERLPVQIQVIKKGNNSSSEVKVVG